MNIGCLKNEMQEKAREWEGMLDPSPVSDLSIGRRVERWLEMFERVTGKLENPRKLREARLEMQLEEAQTELKKAQARLGEATDPRRPDNSNDSARN